MTPEDLRLEVELEQFGHRPNPDDLLAYCELCGDELTETVEFLEARCLPCQLGSVPRRVPGTITTLLYSADDRAGADGGVTCARCDAIVADEDASCWGCGQTFGEAFGEASDD